jgi:mono/diheme cytochrome c family protein
MKTVIAVVVGGLAVCLFASQLRFATAAQPETTQLIASVDGPALYNAYCAVCHGIDARGGGPMAASLKAAPADLTRIAARNAGVYPAARMERIISGQEMIPGGHGTRTMPVWGPIFSQIARDQDLGRLRIHNLAEYLKKVQAR